MTQYIIFDCESVPDGKLIRMIKYPKEDMSESDAIARLKEDILQSSQGKTDFISPVFQIPVAVCLAKVDKNYLINELVLLDSPEFRCRSIAEDFWKGVSHYKVPLISFNGRGFDLPLLEIAAFRYGLSVPFHFSDRYGSRYRFGDKHIDLMDWITNYGVMRQGCSLDLLSKLLGKPGKMSTKGSDVYDMYEQGQIREINEYCSYDVLDTYFVFLRYQVLTGKITIKDEQDIVGKAKAWIQQSIPDYPFLEQYLDNWGDWAPWI